MERLERYGVWFIGILLTAVLSIGRVAAGSTAADEPQAGFGVLLAVGAIILALIIARHKRRQYV